MTPKLSTDLCGVTLKNPVMVASGTFGSGEEFSEFPHFSFPAYSGVV